MKVCSSPVFMGGIESSIEVTSLGSLSLSGVSRLTDLGVVRMTIFLPSPDLSALDGARRGASVADIPSASLSMEKL